MRTLTNDESLRLDAGNAAGMTRNPDKHCATCGGQVLNPGDERRFRWWAYDSMEDPGGEGVGEYDCPCVEQWILSRFFLHSGIKGRYQTLGWRDLLVKGEIKDKVQEYLAESAYYVTAGYGMMLHGPVGTGKTMMLQLVCKLLLGEGMDAHAVTFAEFLAYLMNSWDDPEDALWYSRRIRNVPVLLIDDLGKEHEQRYQVAGKEGGLRYMPTTVAESGLDDLIRHRVASRLPTLITTNLIDPDADITSRYGHFGAGIVSLLSECSTSIWVPGADYRTQIKARIDREVKLRLRRPLVFG